MMMKSLKCLLSCCGVGMLMVAGLTGCGQKSADPSVIANLQAAYNGESNASAKYAMYAEKAAEAGYKDVAAFFRAASKAEGLHAARQAKVLKSFGVEPQAEIKLPAYIDVAASLKDAVAGETYEKDTMYPEFIANAKAKGAPAAVIEAFQFALEAEKEHARIYSLAAADLEQWKNTGRIFYVCSVCGYTLDKPFAVCVLCAAPQEKILEFK